MIHYGDRPEARTQLHQVIDDQIGEGLDKRTAERALHRDLLTAVDVKQTRLQMEEARSPPPQ